MSSEIVDFPKIKSSRVKASEDALVKAIRAAQTCGLTVHNMCIEGGKIELQFQPIEQAPMVNNPAPKSWG